MRLERQHSKFITPRRVERNPHNYFFLYIFFFTVFFFYVIFVQPYAFVMVLLTRGRISFGGFLCLSDPFWYLSLLFLPPMITQYSMTMARMLVLMFPKLFFFPFLLNTTLLCLKVQRPCTANVVRVITYFV